MGEAKQFETISNGYSRDLLHRLTSSNHNFMGEPQHPKEEESEEIELNLGLSLGGRFGVDPNPKSSNKLLRSSSIAGITNFSREEDAITQTPVMFPLGRTSSLPMETEEEWRKRKELQSLRRMEAKRKRTEKLIKLGRDRASLERNSDDKRVDEEGLVNKGKGDGSTSSLPAFLTNSMPINPQQQQQQQQQFMFGNGYSPSRVNSLPVGMPNWTSGGMGSVMDNSPNGKAAPPPQQQQQQQQQGFIPPSTQGSLGSHGSSSSGTSEFDSRVIQGNCNETKSPARSPASVQSLVEKNEQKPNIAPPIDSNTAVTVKVELESPSKKPKVDDNVKKEVGMKAMEDMPCVSTKGVGPNGRRIEGFLYRYKKGEEVRIVCVCHGSFLTPAEFVKHAGGDDVAHPLRHIVVTPSASLLS